MSELSMKEFCPTSFRLEDSQLCLECERVHVGRVCPVCQRGPSVYLTIWIKSMEVLELKQIFYGGVGHGTEAH